VRAHPVAPCSCGPPASPARRCRPLWPPPAPTGPPAPPRRVSIVGGTLPWTATMTMQQAASAHTAEPRPRRRIQQHRAPGCRRASPASASALGSRTSRKCGACGACIAFPRSIGLAGICSSPAGKMARKCKKKSLSSYHD